MTGPWDVLVVPAQGATYPMRCTVRPPLELLITSGPCAWRSFRLHLTELGLAYVERAPQIAA